VDWAIGESQAVLVDAGSAARARALCDAAGLAVCGACVQEPGVDFSDAEAMGRYAAVARVLGAPHIRAFAPRYDGRDLRPLFETAQGAVGDLCLIVETSPDTAVPSAELARRLVDGLPTDRAGVLYDPGNMVIEGHLAPRIAVDLLGPYLRHVHVKNIGWERHDGDWRWQYASLRDGLLDWPQILGELGRTGYDRFLAFDHLPGGADATTEQLAEEVALMRDAIP
jgi:sugar phosphate isomerase/epimerase